MEDGQGPQQEAPEEPTTSASMATLADDSSLMLFPFPCCACGVEKSDASFSKTQMRKARPRCTNCVASQAPARQDVDKPSFHRCSSSIWRQMSKLQCPLCEARAERKRRSEHLERPKRENEANRTRARGACRVKEVKQRYGHLCEIPLQAYAEAGVAFSWNHFVTDQDVEAASTAWDARSLAHDIDTQWGTMPWGGAYKDSNTYFGPGE